MNDRTKIYSFVFIIWLVGVCFIVATSENIISPEEQPAKFVISSWSYPDDYDQGIALLIVYENESGSWVSEGTFYYYTANNIIEHNASVGIKIWCATWLNNTLVGATNITDAMNYHRHNITVTDAFGTEIFTQNNFTMAYNDSSNDPMFLYGYEVIFDFLPQPAQQYYVSITYEVYYKTQW